MTASWFSLLAFAAVLIFRVQCDSLHQNKDWKVEHSSFSDALFGFKPCVDESCGGYAPVPETETSYKPPEPDAHYPEDNPRVYCIMLRPSATQTLGEIERMHPDISSIKYRVFEELLDHMYSFATLELENCEPAMKLVDLVILAANSLQTQYVLEGAANCTYRGIEHVPTDDATEMPCKQISSEYGHEATALCPDSTMKPIVKTPVPEKPAEPVYEPCPGGVHKTPCYPSVDPVTEVYTSEDEVEIIAEGDEWEHKNPIVGSLRGIPGVHYPNYTEIPITSFTCADKKCLPGFYADLETGCQVFHVCYEHRRESFLCPIGTTFNQPILACDYWYSSNCSLAPHYYDVNEKTVLEEETIDMEVEEILTSIAESEESGHGKKSDVGSDMDKIEKFFPVKILVTETKPEIPIKPKTPAVEEVASEIVDKMATTATKIVSSIGEVVKSIPEPQENVYKKVKPAVVPLLKKPKLEALLAKSVVPLAKAKLAAIPVSKVTALKAAVPLAVGKTKFIKAAAIPAIKAAVVAPAVKTKIVASAIPAAKAVVAAPVLVKTKVAAVPLATKAKVVAKAAVAAPVIAKAKVAAVPAMKIVSAKATIPVVAKVASVVPKVAIKSSIPAVKAKKIASAVPIAKTKIVPVMKGKVIKGVATPLLKTKMFSLPLAKAKFAAPVPIAKVKLAKAAAISPLTKKALTLGYMKLLKAKKIALMG